MNLYKAERRAPALRDQNSICAIKNFIRAELELCAPREESFFK